MSPRAPQPFAVYQLLRGSSRRRADNFWVKEKVWLQQPTVQFKHTALVMVEGATAGTAAHWSTEPSVNKLYGSCVPSPPPRRRYSPHWQAERRS